MWAVEVHGGRLFSASADKTIRVWNVESRRCEQVMEDHTRPVLSLAISNGKIYSGSYDYSIKVCVLAPHGAVCTCVLWSESFVHAPGSGHPKPNSPA